MARLQLLNVSGVEMRDLNVVAELRELWLNEPTPHKSVDYRHLSEAFQASRKQSQSLHVKLIK
jgi:hypothetical protein